MENLLLLLALQSFVGWWVHAEKAYPLGCSTRDPSFYDYERFPFPPKPTHLEDGSTVSSLNGVIPIRTVDDFLILRRLGTGKFSDVFEAVDVAKQPRSSSKNRKNNERQVVEPIDPASIVVLKCLKPVSERKIRREVLVLQHASRLPNLARILGVVLPPTPDITMTKASTALPRMPTLVLAHAGQRSQWLCHNLGSSRAGSGPQDGKVSNENDDILTEYEIRYYLFHLLVALDSLHSCGIMHRDVKPRNVLIHRGGGGNSQRSLMLIDLGLADFYLPNQRYNVRVASRHYKSPELLVQYEWYDYALDLWGVGCILAGLLFRREPLFRGRDNLDQLGKILLRLGTSDLIAYAVKYHMQLSPAVQNLISEYHHTRGAIHRLPWTDYLVRSNGSNAAASPAAPFFLTEFQSQGIDLLDKLLVYDHEVRWTARQAMRHPFFDAVREEVLHQIHNSNNVMHHQQPLAGVIDRTPRI